jgi:two-component system nitrate/nitrite response regulator NarL
MTRSRIAIFHPEGLQRDTLAELLSGSDFEVVPGSAGLPPVPSEPATGVPDLALVCESFIRTDFEHLKRWCASRTCVVVLADTFSFPDLRTVMRMGASGYLVTRINANALTLALGLALTGETVFPSEIGELLVGRGNDNGMRRRGGTEGGSGAGSRNGSGHGSPDGPDGDPEAGVSVLGYPGIHQRDIHILALVARGRTNKDIADELGSTEESIKMRLSSIMRLVKVRNRTQAAVWAIQNGLVDARPAAAKDQGGALAERRATVRG